MRSNLPPYPGKSSECAEGANGWHCDISFLSSKSSSGYTEVQIYIQINTVEGKKCTAKQTADLGLQALSLGSTRALLFLLPPTAAFTKYILHRELHFSTPFAAQSHLYKHHQAPLGCAARQQRALVTGIVKKGGDSSSSSRMRLLRPWVISRGMCVQLTDI